MYKPLRTGALVLFAILVGSIAGCGSADDVPPEKVDEPVKINLIATAPENGGQIPVDGDLRIVFDNPPKSVTVDGKPTIILNNTVIVKIADLPNVIPGTEQTVIIEWKNPDNSVAGAKTLTFTVLNPVENLPQSDDDDGEEEDGEEEDGEEGTVEQPSATTATTSPAAGSEITPNTSLIITLDEAVDGVTVNGTAAAGSRKTWIYNLAGLNLPAGRATLNIGWTNRDGTAGAGATVTFTIQAEADRTAPSIDSGSVRNNDINVDPARLNLDGISFTFSEDVKDGNISISIEGGDALNWLSEWSRNSVIMVPAKGAELRNETSYEIKVSTEDEAGNKLDSTIWFVTRGKE